MENSVLRERLVDRNGWQHYVYHQVGTSAFHDIPTITMLEHNWDRDINDFTTTTTKVQVAVNKYFPVSECSYLPISCATVKNYFKDSRNNKSKKD